VCPAPVTGVHGLHFQYLIVRRVTPRVPKTAFWVRELGEDNNGVKCLGGVRWVSMLEREIRTTLLSLWFYLLQIDLLWKVESEHFTLIFTVSSLQLGVMQTVISQNNVTEYLT